MKKKVVKKKASKLTKKEAKEKKFPPAASRILSKDLEKMSDKDLVSHYNMLRDYLETKMSEFDLRVMSVVLEAERELTLRETD